MAYQADLSFAAALAAGVLPFIPGDLAKMVIAAVVGPQIRRRLAQAQLLRNGQ
ncbi:MAG: biotin transporter BioY [Butyricicoccus sp.]